MPWTGAIHATHTSCLVHRSCTLSCGQELYIVLWTGAMHVSWRAAPASCLLGVSGAGACLDQL